MRHYRKPIPDQCTSRQRRLLDEWQRIGCRGHTVFAHGSFYVLLKVTKTTGYHYGVFGAMDASSWPDIEKEVRNGLRAEKREREKQALLDRGAYV